MPPKRKRDDEDVPNNPLTDAPDIVGSSDPMARGGLAKEQAVQQQSGAPVKKKRPMNLALLIEAGLVRDGGVLRYMKGKGLEHSSKLMAVGRASMEGVLVQGKGQPMGLSAFEAYAGSSAHRPAQFTFTSSGLSLQQLMQKHSEGKGVGSAPKSKPGRWGLTAEGRSRAAHSDFTPPNADDPNDELCRICLQGGDLLCCESCPGVLHAGCAGLPAVPDGDWHCPHCVCAGCGHAGFGARADLEPASAQVTWVQPGLDGRQPVWKGPLDPEQKTPVVTVPALAFDLQWSKEGKQAAARQAAVQNPPKAEEAAAVKAENKTEKQMGSVEALGQPGEGIKHEAGEPGSPRSPRAWREPPRPASAGRGRGSPTGRGWGRGRGRGRGRGAGQWNRAQTPELIDIDEFVDLARGAQSKDSLTEALDERFPKVAGSAAALQPLRNLFYSACPDHNWKGRQVSLPVLVDSLWKAAFAADTPRRRPGRPRKAPLVSQDSEDVSHPPEDSHLDAAEAVTAAATETGATIVSGAPEAAVTQGTGGNPGRIASEPALEQEGGAVPAANQVRLVEPVPSDSGSELDICTVADGSPPILRPSRFSNADLPATAETHSSPAEPAAGTAVADATEAKQPAAASGAAEAAGELPGTPGPAAGSCAEASAVPEQAMPAAAEATLQNGLPEPVLPNQQAGGVTSILAADPKAVAAIAAAASQFLKKEQSQHEVADDVTPRVAAEGNGQLEQQPTQAAAQCQTNGISTLTAAQAEPASECQPASEQDHGRTAAEGGKLGPQKASEGAAPLSSFLQAVKREMVACLQSEPMAVVHASTAADTVASAAIMAAAEEQGGLVTEVEEAVPMEMDAAIPAALPMTIEEAAHEIGRPVRPAAGSAPEGNAAVLVVCGGCGQRRHLGCLPAADQTLAVKGAWFHSEGCRAVDAELARLAAAGLLPVQAAPNAPSDLAPAWQLVRGTAVSAPQDCRGVAPQYDAPARAQLREVLFAARHIVTEATGGLPDSRTGQDLLPMLLQGKAAAKRVVDFSRFHTAMLWLGRTLAAVGLVRAHGAEVAEVPVLAVRPELQGNGLGRALLAQLESALLAAGVKLLVLPAVPQPSAGEATPQGSGVQHWPDKAGYDPASARQLARLSALPLLHFPTAPYLAKELSADTLTLVTAPRELKMREGVDMAPYVKARLLQTVPLTSYDAPASEAQPADVDREVKAEAPNAPDEAGPEMPADVIMDVADDQLPAAEAVTDSAQEPVMSAAVMSAAADSLAAVALGAERLGPVGGDTRMVDAPAVGHMNLQKGDAGTAEGTAGGLVDNMVDKME